MEALVLGLLSDRPMDRAEAVEELETAGSFRGCTAFQVLTVRVATGPEARTPSTGIPMRVIERALSQRSTGSAVARTDDATVVVIGYAVRPADDHVEGVLTSVLRAIDSLGDAVTGDLTVGVGSVVSDLARVVASHEQAELARRIARANDLRSFWWDRAELDGMIAALLPEHVAIHLLPRRVTDAIADQSEENLLAVRSYLANAGNVVKTSAELHLHRTTVYYRLGRFHETTGLDLDDGDTRLMLHLWFRMQSFVTVERD
jgi:sugar diacid utilization regulator